MLVLWPDPQPQPTNRQKLGGEKENLFQLLMGCRALFSTVLCSSFPENMLEGDTG